MKADELAQMVLDPKDRTRIRLDHSAFNHPRESWDKILATPAFEKVEKSDLIKLMLCYPETRNWRDDEDAEKHLDQVKNELESIKLEAHLPKLEYLDAALRKRDGHAEFIILVQYEIETAAVFEAEVDTEDWKDDLSEEDFR